MDSTGLDVMTINPDFEYVDYNEILSSFPEEDKCGLRVTSGSVTLTKQEDTLIGISIGGGVPHCPCIYIVQIFDNTISSRNGTLEAGDEITAIDKRNIRGLTRADVARLIQKSQNSVTIYYNKLHLDSKKGNSIDLVLKKIKHRFVENLSSSAADFLGLSRAVLVNDSLVKRLEGMQNCAKMFRELATFIEKLNRANMALAEVHQKLAEIFDEIGVKESQSAATEAFHAFSRGQRTMQKYLDTSYNDIQQIIENLKTFYKKVIPDTKMTVKKYLNAKFEYLAYCLKIKELDDEESCFVAMNESLYRIETGNYEYRFLLRCRQESRKRFAKMRNDVLEKLELLDNKHVQDIVKHLGKFMEILRDYYAENYSTWKKAKIFPIEIDISGMTCLMNDIYNYDESINESLNNYDDFESSDDYNKFGFQNGEFKEEDSENSNSNDFLDSSNYYQSLLKE